MSRPLASLSLDLDNQWSYMKTHGDPGWESYPSYLDIVVPRVLDLLAVRNLRITFFVVGQDAARPENRSALASLAAAGHEIGNHSFRHEPWFHLYEEAEIDDELARTEDVLEEVCGQRPIGFRGPGFSLSETTLRVLQRRGYLYDCSTLPTWLGPLARAYYFLTAKLSEKEKKQRARLFGTIGEGLRPVRPYQWEFAEKTLLEIPVTTMPLLKVPIHVSYLLYLDRFSAFLANRYFATALALCRWTKTQPSLLLHPLDFLGGDDVRELAFFPAMDLPGARKAERTMQWVDALAKHWDIVPMHAHAEAILQQGGLPRRRPDFRAA